MQNSKNTKAKKSGDNVRIAFAGASYDDPIDRTFNNNIDVYNNKKYVSYGKNNDFPNYLYEAYLQCGILQGIINGIVDSLYKRLSSIDISEDDLLKCLYDYIIFGGYAVEVLRSKAGSTVKINHLPFENIRVSADKKVGFFSNKWGRFTSKYVELPLNDSTATHSIYYYSGRLSRGVYPLPMYFSALKSIEIQNEIKNFHLATIKNNFNSNLIININNGNYSMETQKKVENMLNEKFSGAKNAGKMMLLFNDSKENAADAVRLESDKFDEKYQSLDKSTKEDIFIAFRATPCLFGLMPENNGFSKEEYAEAMNLFEQNVLEPLLITFVHSFKAGDVVIVDEDAKVESNQE